MMFELPMPRRRRIECGNRQNERQDDGQGL
jgi:hypothetical protein